MPRGWKQADDIAQAVWRQILRGPRPPSVSWPAAQGKFSSKGKGKGQGVVAPSAEKRGHRDRRWQTRGAQSDVSFVPPDSRRKSPDVLAGDNQAQIDRLERAISVLGEDSVDAAGLIATLKKVRAQSIQPIGERLDACQQFVERARKRFVAAEDAVMKALQTKSRLESELNEGVQRLQRLREEAAAQPRAPTAEHGEVPPVPPEAQAEVNQLRATIEDLQRERDRLRSEVSRQRAGDMLSRGNRFNPLA